MCNLAKCIWLMNYIITGNFRGYSGDVVITEVSRVLGIPTVAELLALHPHPGMYDPAYASLT